MSITYAELAKKLTAFGQERSEWAGLPIPVKNHNLRLEPRFPYQFHVCEIDETQQGDNCEVVNRWFNERLRCDVAILRDGNGKLSITPMLNNGGMKLLSTLFCSVVWPLEAELKAQEKLASMVTPHAFTTYVTTGCFVESSKRSGVAYIFRRLRPTVAMKADRNDEMRILATLCLHPIGYYAGTWAGVMTPTDDVIAHLCMMRGDEPKFWANAEQHPAFHPASGL